MGGVPVEVVSRERQGKYSCECEVLQDMLTVSGQLWAWGIEKPLLQNNKIPA